jgi:hypothetical protein
LRIFAEVKGVKNAVDAQLSKVNLMTRRFLTAVAAVLGFISSPASPQERGWDVLKGDDSGHQLVIRHLSILPSWAGKAALPKLVAVTWRLENAGQMPTKSESKQTYEFEDILSAAVESQRVGILTTVVTGNGVVEWQYYAASHDSFMAALNQALLSRPKYPITIALQEDPKWSAYSRFTTKK